MGVVTMNKPYNIDLGNIPIEDLRKVLKVYTTQFDRMTAAYSMGFADGIKKITAPGGNPETVNGENDSVHISPKE